MKLKELDLLHIYIGVLLIEKAVKRTMKFSGHMRTANFPKAGSAKPILTR